MTEENKFCFFVRSPEENILECIHCGLPRYSIFPPEKTYRVCMVGVTVPIKKTMKAQLLDGDWGDLTEEILLSIGITKSWWRKLIRGECKCSERQAIFNAVGRWLMKKNVSSGNHETERK